MKTNVYIAALKSVVTMKTNFYRAALNQLLQ